MKFLADMGISPKTVDFLRSLGYDAVHLREQQLDRLPDPLIVKKALAEGRIVLTHDLGFGDLLAASRAQLPSVIIFRLKNMRPERVNKHLDEILKRYHTALQEGIIVSVNEKQIRAHRLPM